MLILQPQRNRTLVRQLADHTDTGTYYVRAVVRNAYTDAILNTLNLTDKGSQRFSVNWQTPADGSGEGLEISVVTSVYTDSGYTTKSANYGDEENTYLVFDLIGNRGFGGGGTDVDYSKVRRIVKEEIEKIPKPKPIDLSPLKQKPIEMRWDDVLQTIENEAKSILSAVNAKTPVKLVSADMDKILSATSEARETITRLEKQVAEYQKETEIESERLGTLIEDVNKVVQKAKEMSAQDIEKISETTQKISEGMKFLTSAVNFVGGKGKILSMHKYKDEREEELEQEPELDLIKLAS